MQQLIFVISSNANKRLGAQIELNFKMNFLTWILALHVTVSSVHSKNKRIGHSGVVVVVVVVGGEGGD